MPVVSVLDEQGALIEEGQRALVRFVIQDGHGADLIFAAGTTGEWNRLRNSVRQRVIQSSDQIESGTAYQGTSATPMTPTASQNAAARCDLLMQSSLHRRVDVFLPPFEQPLAHFA